MIPPHRTIKPSVLYFGTPVALLTTCNLDGSANISPLSSAFALDDRIVLGLGAGGQGLANLHRDGACVVNIPQAAQWRAVEALAPTTGAQPVPSHKAAMGFTHVADKFAAAGLTPLASQTVTPPRIAECPLQFEAELVRLHASGGGDWREGAGAFAIAEVRVLRTHAHEAVTVAGKDHVDVARWRPLFYVFRRYVAAGEILGETFRATD